MKFNPTIPANYSANAARQIASTVHRLTQGIGTHDILVITKGADGNLYHSLTRATINETLQSVVQRAAGGEIKF